MPPRESAAARALAPTSFDALPQPVALRILVSLPADARLLAAGVCRAWRAILAERSLWTRLDLSDARSDMPNPRRLLLLRAAAARAGGQLEVLHMFSSRDFSLRELRPVLQENAGTLCELYLSLDNTLSSQVVEWLLRDAPGLRLLEASMYCGLRTLPALRKEPPFGPLRLKCGNFVRGGGVQQAAQLSWQIVVDCTRAHPPAGDARVFAVSRVAGGAGGERRSA